MQAVTKMGDLTKFRQSDDFYAINITRDGPNMLANLTIFIQIKSREFGPAGSLNTGS